MLNAMFYLELFKPCNSFCRFECILSVLGFQHVFLLKKKNNYLYHS